MRCNSGGAEIAINIQKAMHAAGQSRRGRARRRSRRRATRPVVRIPVAL